MKKDCRDIFTFVKEWRRRGKIEGTPYSLKFDVADITGEVVNELQKWSDEHKGITRKEKLMQQYPDINTWEIKPCNMDKHRFLDERARCKMQRDDKYYTCHCCNMEFWNEEIEK